MTLKKPFHALSASGVGGCLEQGFGAQWTGTVLGQVFQAHRCLYGIAPDTVHAVGRWKNRETFEHYYVHSQPAGTFVDQMLLHNSLDSGLYIFKPQLCRDTLRFA